MKIQLLIFEDSKSKMDSFVEFLELKLSNELGSTLSIVQRDDNSMLESDLNTTDFHVILIDDDLGNGNWGNNIIDEIIELTDSTPGITNIPKIYYSAGTSVSELKEKIEHHGNIPCVTFENLVDAVFNRIKAKYFPN